MIDTGDIDVFLGLDVDKGEHHATAVTPAVKKAFVRVLVAVLIQVQINVLSSEATSV